jgi:hypothetical protein
MLYVHLRYLMHMHRLRPNMAVHVVGCSTLYHLIAYKCHKSLICLPYKIAAPALKLSPLLPTHLAGQLDAFLVIT